MQYKRSYESKEIDHKLEDHFAIEARFIYLAFVGKPKKNQCITPSMHVCLLSFRVSHTQSNLERISGSFYVVNCHLKISSNNRQTTFIHNVTQFTTWPQRINSDASIWRDANKQKYLSRPNLSENWIINSFIRVKTG